MLHLALLVALYGGTAFGWGELGHQIIGKSAAKLVQDHPLLIQAKKEAQNAGESGKADLEAIRLFGSNFNKRWLQQGHVSNIPDIHWRNLEGTLPDGTPMETVGKIFGDNAHFLNPERFLGNFGSTEFFKTKIPLNYAEAKAALEALKPGLSIFRDLGTVPWRAQQMTDLYADALRSLKPSATVDCGAVASKPTYPARAILTYAGLLSHFIGDAAQPLHVTADYDGQAVGQKGIHGYFETQIVDSLEATLESKVRVRGLQLLKATADVEPHSVAALHRKVSEVYPMATENQKVTAMVLALAADSYSRLQEVRDLDRQFAFATEEEALKLCPGNTHPPCRRYPDTKIEGKTVAGAFEPLVVERLALASATLADVWVETFLAAGKPKMCWSWLYANKPAFISPTDPKCHGYSDEAKEADVPAFADEKTGKVYPHWPLKVPSTAQCAAF